MSSIGSFPFTPWYKSFGILLIFYDRVNRASQKQEFRSQRAREMNTDTKQLASGEIELLTDRNATITINVPII